MRSVRGVWGTLGRGVCDLGYPPGYIAGDLERSHRDFREGSAMGLGLNILWCEDHGERYILGNPVRNGSLVEEELGKVCEFWRRDHSDVSCRCSKSVKGVLYPPIGDTPSFSMKDEAPRQKTSLAISRQIHSAAHYRDNDKTHAPGV
jgi:hypothetical protein